jgi:hypothetical protein
MQLARLEGNGELHPADAKSALVMYLDELIAAGRAKLAN